MTGNRCVHYAAWICFVLLGLLPAVAAAVDCSEVNISPVADFAYDVVPSESAPVKVNFYSTAKGGRVGSSAEADPIASYLWKFGDGDVSDKASPVHTYAISSARYEAPDVPYMVSLTVRTECGRSSSATTNISVYCLSQKAGFTIIQPAGEGPYTAPVALYVKDTSLHVADGVTAYRYTLWNAARTRLYKEATEKNPTFIITNSGRYVIRQEVVKGCSNPPAADTVMEQTIEVTGSAASDAFPMETIPFTTAMPEGTRTATLPATPAPSPSPTGAEPLPPEEIPGTGMLSVNTSPDGAAVFVNDVRLGESPAVIRGFQPGPYTLRLEKSGYRTRTAHFTIDAEKTTIYSATLEPESAGPGIVPVLEAVVVLAAGAGAVYWLLKKRKPRQPDWNNPD